MVNGMLAGLVAITAPCAFVSPWAAAVIGAIAAVLAIEAVFFLENKGIDDPVGAVAVHGICGSFGVLAVGIFANGVYGAGWNGAVDSDGNGIPVEGVLQGEFGQLGAQVLGLVVIWTVIFGIAYAFFKIQNKLTKGGIRVTEDVEIAGLDIPEMGVAAYND
jgi:ammonium transporter, Amt family